MSTHEVAELLHGAPGVLEANVYGVEVPHCEGRAGMAALRTGAGFDLAALADFVTARLPKYQRPLFVRVLGGGMRTTSTLKHQKVDYRAEGFDPRAIADPLYFFDDDRYVPIDDALFARFADGDVLV